MTFSLAFLSGEAGVGSEGVNIVDGLEQEVSGMNLAAQDIEIEVDAGGKIEATIETAEASAGVVEEANNTLTEAADAGVEMPPAAMEAIRLLMTDRLRDLGYTGRFGAPNYVGMVGSAYAKENFVDAMTAYALSRPQLKPLVKSSRRFGK